MAEEKKKQIIVITTAYRDGMKIAKFGLAGEAMIIEDQREIKGKQQHTRERLKRLGVNFIQMLTTTVPEEMIKEVYESWLKKD